ncbi:MAG: LysR substrate-binding domain-containing protein [Fibrobacterota bacterium]
MNLRDLEYFVAVAELGHFGKAAERCFCSQPTLSGQIKKLEDELGVPLFERFPGGVRLTGLGEQCLPAAREAISATHRMTEFGKASRDPESGELVLGAIPTIGPYLWPAALASLQERFPKLVALLREEPTRQLLESLRSGRVDAGILALPLENTGLDFAELWEEPFLLAVHATHPLAGQKLVETSVLEEMELLLLDDGHCLREQALEVCRSSGARERDGFRATSLESLRHMVRSGAGTTLLPASAAREEAGLAIIPFLQPPYRKVALCWRKGHPRSGFFPELARNLSGIRPF